MPKDLKKIIQEAASSFSILEEPIQLDQKIYQSGAEKNELFKHYPNLAQKLSYISLADFPSPIIHCKNLEKNYPHTHIFIKDDGAMLPISPQQGINKGANKLRKLQYILADARAYKYTDLITFGCVGSNHALQTTLSGKKLGFTCWNMLLDQPNSTLVRDNLLLHKAHDSTLIYCPSRAARIEQTLTLYQEIYAQTGKRPYIIPTGGSSPRGTIGFVEAVYELKAQIDAGLMPMPESIYLPVGSAGIAAGVLLGIKSLGLPIHVYCILTEPDNQKQDLAKKIEALFAATNRLLLSYDKDFPSCTLSGKDYTVITEHAGLDYGLFTSEGNETLRFMYEQEKIVLDGIYSAKACAGFLNALKSGQCANKTVLFWNSFCPEKFKELTDTITYKTLPEQFHNYFTEPLQPLDISPDRPASF